MAKVKLILDTRAASQSKVSGLFPVAIRVFNRKAKIMRLPYYTSEAGWDSIVGRLKKSAKANKNQNCERINIQLNRKLQQAREVINSLGEEVHHLTLSELVDYIKESWSEASTNKLQVVHSKTPGLRNGPKL